MVNTEIRLIILFEVKDGEALYSQQKQDQELTVAQTGWGRVRQIPSLCGVGGETGYTAQEDLKYVNSYDMGEGRIISVWFFRSCLPRPSLVLSAQEKRNNDQTGFFRLYRGVTGLWSPFACFFVRVHLWREMRVHGMIR